MCAVRGAGSCTGVVTVLLPVLRARRRPLAPTGSLTESASSREELPELPLCDCPGGEKSRPWARSQVSRGRRDASDECALVDATGGPDVEATVSSDNENKEYVRQ